MKHNKRTDLLSIVLCWPAVFVVVVIRSFHEQHFSQAEIIVTAIISNVQVLKKSWALYKEHKGRQGSGLIHMYKSQMRHAYTLSYTNTHPHPHTHAHTYTHTQTTFDMICSWTGKVHSGSCYYSWLSHQYQWLSSKAKNNSLNQWTAANVLKGKLETGPELEGRGMGDQNIVIHSHCSQLHSS